MKSSKWIVLTMVAITFVFVGCTKNSSNVDTAPVERSFASAEPTTKTTAEKAVSAIKAGDYASGLTELKTLASNAKLTPEQQQEQASEEIFPEVACKHDLAWPYRGACGVGRQWGGGRLWKGHEVSSLSLNFTTRATAAP